MSANKLRVNKLVLHDLARGVDPDALTSTRRLGAAIGISHATVQTNGLLDRRIDSEITLDVARKIAHQLNVPYAVFVVDDPISPLPVLYGEKTPTERVGILRQLVSYLDLPASRLARMSSVKPDDRTGRAVFGGRTSKYYGEEGYLLCELGPLPEILLDHPGWAEFVLSYPLLATIRGPWIDFGVLAVDADRVYSVDTWPRNVVKKRRLHCRIRFVTWLRKEPQEFVVRFLRTATPPTIQEIDLLSEDDGEQLLADLNSEVVGFKAWYPDAPLERPWAVEE